MVAGARGIAMVGGAVALVLVVAWLRLGGTHGGDPRAPASIETADGSRAAPSARPVQAPPAEPEKAPPEGIEEIDGARAINVVGRGESDDLALASARSRAVVLLVDALRAALPAGVAAVTTADDPTPPRARNTRGGTSRTSASGRRRSARARARSPCPAST